MGADKGASCSSDLDSGHHFPLREQRLPFATNTPLNPNFMASKDQIESEDPMSLCRQFHIASSAPFNQFLWMLPVIAEHWAFALSFSCSTPLSADPYSCMLLGWFLVRVPKHKFLPICQVNKSSITLIFLSFALLKSITRQIWFQKKGIHVVNIQEGPLTHSIEWNG